MPKQMTVRRLEIAETRTNYALQVSGKDIITKFDKDSIHGEILRAVILLAFSAGDIRSARKISPCIESLFVISFLCTMSCGA